MRATRPHNPAKTPAFALFAVFAAYWTGVGDGSDLFTWVVGPAVVMYSLVVAITAARTSQNPWWTQMPIDPHVGEPRTAHRRAGVIYLAGAVAFVAYGVAVLDGPAELKIAAWAAEAAVVAWAAATWRRR